MMGCLITWVTVPPAGLSNTKAWRFYLEVLSGGASRLLASPHNLGQDLFCDKLQELTDDVASRPKFQVLLTSALLRGTDKDKK